VHEASAQKRIQRVRVVRQNDFRHFGNRFAHRPGRVNLSFLVSLSVICC